MYRLNFYPLFVERRRREKRRLLGILVVSGVAGIEILCIAGLLIAGVLLGEQASGLRRDAARLTAVLQQRSRPADIDPAARAVLEARAARTDWSPKLAAIPDRIGPSMILDEIDIRGAANGSRGSMKLSGFLRSPGGGTDAVTRLVEGLRAERAISGDFPLVKIDALKDTEFQVSCADTGRAR